MSAVMQHTYLIRELDGTEVEREPTLGKWYCGMDRDHFGPGVHRDGELAQYTGDGYFYDDGDGDDSDMSGYDFLAEQIGGEQ